VEARDIEKLFEKYGKVVKSKMVKDPATGYNVSITLARYRGVCLDSKTHPRSNELEVLLCRDGEKTGG
jgi:hypothetical protein